MKNIFKLLFISVMFFTQASCAKNTDQNPEENQFPPAEPFKYKRDLLYGICEPLYIRALSGDVDVKTEVETMYLLGIRSVRLWMETNTVLISPSQPNDQAVKLYKEIIDECKKRDIVVIGMSHSWNYMQNYQNYLSLPDRNSDPNSDYMKWMVNTFEKTWETMAATFPEIEFWEIANETNGDAFLHKLGYDSDNTKVFTYQQKADITTDLMYYASRGIHQANQQAKVVMPAASPVASAYYYGFEKGVIENFIGKIYANIKSGKWPSKNPRDYFQVASWHPYYLKSGWDEPTVDDQWLTINNQIYEVIKSNGDEGVPVFLTEFGYSDLGSQSKDSLQSIAMTKALKYVKEDMPYVNIINVFRLFDSPRDSIWGGDYQVYFGLFHISGNVTDGYTIQPKEKGKAYANFIGAGRDIYKFSH